MASNGQNILTHKSGSGGGHWPGNCMIQLDWDEPECLKRRKLGPMG